MNSMGRFRIRWLLNDNTSSPRYSIPKNSRYSGSPKDRTRVSLNLNIEKYGIKIIYDQIATPQADMSFRNFRETHSIYKMDNISYFEDLFESTPESRNQVLWTF